MQAQKQEAPGKLKTLNNSKNFIKVRKMLYRMTLCSKILDDCNNLL